MVYWNTTFFRRFCSELDKGFILIKRKEVFAGMTVNIHRIELHGTFQAFLKLLEIILIRTLAAADEETVLQIVLLERRQDLGPLTFLGEPDLGTVVAVAFYLGAKLFPASSVAPVCSEDDELETRLRFRYG